MESLVEYMGWVVAAIAGAFALKTKVKFDVNEWSKEKRRRREDRFKEICPHAEIEHSDDGQIRVHSRYVNRSEASIIWECRDCGKTTGDKNEGERVEIYWASRLKELCKRKKEMHRLAKKLARV